jgi:IS30 family transposase
MAKKIGNKKAHLCYEERWSIEKMLKAGETLTNIAKILGRGLSSMSAEVKLNGGRGTYTAKKAQLRAYWKQYRKKRDCNKVAMTPGMARIVERELANRHSPEEIAALLKHRRFHSTPSAKSIRKFIASRHSLERFLFWSRTKKKSGPKKSTIFLKDPGRKSIAERPIEATTEYGHWEMDFIVSALSSVVLLVLVEKQTKLVRLAILPNRENALVNGAVTRLLAGYTVRSLTTDNDIAFGDWRTLELMIGAPIYFCHPYHSWEKGLVENTNRWLREFIKKKTDIAGYTNEFIADVEQWMNHGPRVCLRGASAYEMMMQKEKNIFVSSLSINFPNYLRIGG